MAITFLIIIVFLNTLKKGLKAGLIYLIVFEKFYAIKCFGRLSTKRRHFDCFTSNAVKFTITQKLQLVFKPLSHLLVIPR